jgi:hypothetical protein
MNREKKGLALFFWNNPMRDSPADEKLLDSIPKMKKKLEKSWEVALSQTTQSAKNLHKELRGKAAGIIFAHGDETAIFVKVFELKAHNSKH